MTFDPTYVLHLGRLGRLRALLPKWAHDIMENCKTHTLLPTHRFGIATQASPSRRLGLQLIVGSMEKGLAQYEVHWRVRLGAMDPPNGHATQHMAHTTYCPKR